jgi:hypothetical protein
VRHRTGKADAVLSYKQALRRLVPSLAAAAQAIQTQAVPG